MAGAGTQVSVGRLPGTGGELFGRERELAWLDECWATGVRVVSIAAWGGVGKSALVRAWLNQMDADRGRGAVNVFGWSFYSQGTDRLGSSDEFFAVALRKFGETGEAPRSPWEKGERLAELVGAQRSILVLDGLEPLQWGPGVQEGRLKDQAVEALLKGLAGQSEGMCLVTTRIEVAELNELGGVRLQQRKLERLSAEAAAALLRARGVKGSEQELRAAAEEYKGHGLALTLLSSYLGDVADGDVRRRTEIGALAEDERHGGHARRVMAKKFFKMCMRGASSAALSILTLISLGRMAQNWASLPPSSTRLGTILCRA